MQCWLVAALGAVASLLIVITQLRGGSATPKRGLPHKTPTATTGAFVTPSGRPRTNCAIFVGVVSGPSEKHKELREAQRHTWLTRVAPDCRRFFLGGPVSLDLRRESETEGDVVVLDVEDLYGHVEFQLLVKSDDDTYVVWRQFAAQAARLPQQRAWLGYANAAWVPMRSGKWGVSWDVYPQSHGPPYTSGFLYAASADCVAFYAAKAGKGWPRVHLEDVDFALAMEEYGVRPLALTHEQVVATHHLTPRGMRTYFEHEQKWQV